MTALRHVLSTSAELLAGHQLRYKAGVPGCSCGEAFAEGTGHLPEALHAAHVSPIVVLAVLRAAAAALQAGLPAPAAAAAVSVLAGMVRNETPAPRRKALQQ